MKKWICITLCLLACGCSTTSAEKEAKEIYDNHVKALIDNKGVESINIPFNHQLEMKKEKDHYTYEIVISEPDCAMYDVEFMIVDSKQVDKKVKHANLGIYKEEVYNMVPYQKNEEKRFFDKLSLSGTTKDEKGTLYAMVSWKDYAKLNTNHVYFTYQFHIGEE